MLVGLTWYVVHTAPRSEWNVHQGLRRLRYYTLHLHYRGMVRHAGRSVAVMKPLFPRYLFVGAEDGQGLYDVNEFPGVATVLYGAEGAYEVPPELIEELRARGGEGGLVEGYEQTQQPSEGRCPQRPTGPRVRIADGPLRGLYAAIIIDGGGMCRVKVEMFKGEVEADLSADALKSASP